MSDTVCWPSVRQSVGGPDVAGGGKAPGQRRRCDHLDQAGRHCQAALPGTATQAISTDNDRAVQPA